VLNPNLFKHEAARQAALAIVAGIVIHLILTIPVSVSAFAQDHPS